MMQITAMMHSCGVLPTTYTFLTHLNFDTIFQGATNRQHWKINDGWVSSLYEILLRNGQVRDVHPTLDLSFPDRHMLIVMIVAVLPLCPVRGMDPAKVALKFFMERTILRGLEEKCETQCLRLRIEAGGQDGRGEQPLQGQGGEIMFHWRVPYYILHLEDREGRAHRPPVQLWQ